MSILETHIVPAIENRIRLQEYAPTVLTYIHTRSALKKAVKRKQIHIDGVPGKTSDWIQQGQKIEVLRREKSKEHIFPLKLEIIFEDEDIAVVNKPSGYPSSGNYFKTIENALSFNLKDSSKKDALVSPLPAHRLDKPTTGCLVIAKTSTALHLLHRDFENRSVQKKYLAVVSGLFPASAFFRSEIEGKPSSTAAKLIDSVRYKEKDYSLVEVIPETGRTHQIRIHLSSHGFPVVGDKTYGEPGEKYHNKSLFLCATELSVTHPVTKELMSFRINLPRRFKKTFPFRTTLYGA